MEHPQDKEIQICLNKVPGVIYRPLPRGLNFYIAIYMEIIKKYSSQELLY